jgi:FAD/FMN-containing dehydrogenase
MNKVSLISPYKAVLGPGGTWKQVLETIPPTKFTLIHGQCTSVGVGGYILGGGINAAGTTERYGAAIEHVDRYTMVDAKGRILLVHQNN